MNTLEVLRRSDIFHYLDEDELKLVEKMCTPQVFETGAVICRQDAEMRMYLCY